MPAGPDPTTTTSQVFSHHAIRDGDEADADSDDVEEDVTIVEGKVLCALVERIKIIRKKRWQKIEEEEAIEEVGVSIFNRRSQEFLRKSKTNQEHRY